MRVTVTGGTGFVGSHTVAALVRDGHDVRILARSPDRVAPALQPLGVDTGAVEVVPGDVTRRDDVERALEGGEGVVHAAAMYTLDPRCAEELQRTNVRATELVLGAAAERGLRALHVSSVAALVPVRGGRADERTPPGDAPYPYHRSKADSDRVARELQRDGAPIAISYPTAVFGPHDPHLGVSSALLLEGLQRGLVPAVRGGHMNIVDVRDVATLHATVLSDGEAHRGRYIANTSFISIVELWELVSDMTGRRIRAIEVPPAVARPVSKVSDALRSSIGTPNLAPAEGLYSLLETVPADAGVTEERLGMSFRGTEEMIADNIRWLVEAGHLEPHQAGRLAA
jgi:dihydroflavonol-4-reductase